MRNAHEAFRGALKEMVQLLQGDSSCYNDFLVSVREYRRALHVHSQIEDLSMFPLLDSLNENPLGLSQLHGKDDELWAEVDKALEKCQEEIDSNRKKLVQSKAQILWREMLSEMSSCADSIDYSSLVNVVQLSKRLPWFQSALGYLCVLQGLRDTSVDTIYRTLFQELRSLVLFFQTVRNFCLFSCQTYYLPFVVICRPTLGLFNYGD